MPESFFKLILSWPRSENPKPESCKEKAGAAGQEIGPAEHHALDGRTGL
jgi:hypothetical protein